MADVETTTSIVQSPDAAVIITSLRDQALGLLQYASERVVQTLEDTKLATDDLSIIAKAKKALEDKRKEYVTPLNNQVKLINDTFKLVSDPLLQAEKITKDKLLAYGAEQNRIRAEQEAINQAKLDLAKREAQLHNGEFTVDITPLPVIAEPAKRVQTDMGTAGQRDNWIFEIISFADLPDEYKMPDATKIGKLVRAGLRSIPGVRIFNQPIITIKTR